MLGVVSLDSVVGKKRKISTAENLLSLNARVAVNHIIHNALQAVGYGEGEHRGIRIGEQVGDQGEVGPGSFCIKQDIQVLATSVNWTPLDSSDDRWVCYTLDRKDHNIYMCQKPYDAASSYQGAGRCSTGEVVAQAVSWDPQFKALDEEGANKLVFTMVLTTRFDPAKPKSSSNPENTVTVSSSPPGLRI